MCARFMYSYFAIVLLLVLAFDESGSGPDSQPDCVSTRVWTHRAKRRTANRQAND